MGIRLAWQILLVIAACGLSATFGEARQERLSPNAARFSIEDLSAEDLEVRREAAAALVLLDLEVQRLALPRLIDLLLNEKDGQVRLAVFDTLTAMGPEATPAKDALVLALRNNFGGKRQEELHQDYRAALALAAIGGPSVEGLQGLLTNRQENVRAEAIMALGRIGPDAWAAIPDLIGMLGAENERIRREAVLALGQIGEAGIDPLIVAADHEDELIRAGAIEALGQLSLPELDDRVGTLAIEGADDPSPLVRASALRSLIRFELPEETLLKTFAANLRQEEEIVRLSVIRVLVERPDLLSKLAHDLEPLLTAEQEGVARHAAFLLERIGPEAAPLLLNALKDERSRIGPIAEALAQIGKPIHGVLTEAVLAPEPRVREGAVLALGRIRPAPPETLPTLLKGLEDPDPAVRAAFLTAIGELGPGGDEALPALRDRLLDDVAEIRIQAIEILSRSAPRDRRFLDDLLARLQDDDPRVQRRAIETIRALGSLGREAVPVMIEKLESPHPEVRISALEMIGSQGPSAAEAVPALCSLISDPTPDVQTLAIQTLGRLGKEAQAASTLLLALLESETVEIRRASVEALGSLELEAQVLRPHFAEALRDESPEVRGATVRAIQRLGPQGVVFVPDLILAAENPEDRRSVERLLRRFEQSSLEDRTILELVERLNHDEAAVRLLALKFLVLASPSAEADGVLSALQRLQADPSPEVREQAELASKQIKSQIQDMQD